MKRAVVMLALILAVAGPAGAGSKGQLAGALADYDDLRSRALGELQHVDELRAQGYMPDTKDLLDLYKEVAVADQEIHRMYNERMIVEVKTRTPHDQSHLLLALHLGLEQLGKALVYELTFHSGQKQPFLQLLRAKAEEMFVIADREVALAKEALQMK